MGKQHETPDPARHDPATLRMLADEADGRRYLTAFGNLDDTALLRGINVHARTVWLPRFRGQVNAFGSRNQ